MAEEQTPQPANEAAPKAEAPAPAAGEAKPKPEKVPAADGPKAKAAGKAAAGDDKPAGDAKPKKEKPPALEDKPFDQFIQQDFLPSLDKALKANGLGDVELAFERKPLPVVGAPAAEQYWQVHGQWRQGQRQFNIAFTDESISGQKVFSYSDSGAKASTIEQFMGDERKVTLDLLLLYTLQRLNGQKWLTRN